MPDSNPIRMGLIGAGIFARDAHLPALQELGAEIYMPSEEIELRQLVYQFQNVLTG